MQKFLSTKYRKNRKQLAIEPDCDGRHRPSAIQLHRQKEISAFCTAKQV